ncbi:hypothetical protein U9M48_040648 [Paspalum notatum var. saurae]|uniref:Uncharacterized protein n=1 Tax=Paspalum notatum var. saurae TaxID=547442 RepID=A0AAQ3XDF9_PASNO
MPLRAHGPYPRAMPTLGSPRCAANPPLASRAPIHGTHNPYALPARTVRRAPATLLTADRLHAPAAGTSRLPGRRAAPASPLFHLRDVNPSIPVMHSSLLASTSPCATLLLASYARNTTYNCEICRTPSPTPLPPTQRSELLAQPPSSHGITSSARPSCRSESCGHQPYPPPFSNWIRPALRVSASDHKMVSSVKKETSLGAYRFQIKQNLVYRYFEA